MRRKILPLVISIPAVLFLVIGWSWITMAANDPLSPRDNPEFWEKLSSVVTVDSAFRRALPQQLSSAGQQTECL
jgi:hypothetical protein